MKEKTNERKTTLCFSVLAAVAETMKK